MLWKLIVITALSASNYGAATNKLPFQVNSNDPFIRMEQLLIDSENLRNIDGDIRPRFWMNDQPSHLTPYRIHGGVGPASSAF